MGVEVKLENLWNKKKSSKENKYEGFTFGSRKDWILDKSSKNVDILQVFRNRKEVLIKILTSTTLTRGEDEME